MPGQAQRAPRLPGAQVGNPGKGQMQRARSKSRTKTKTEAGPSAPLKSASLGMTPLWAGEVKARERAKATVTSGPSTALRFAQEGSLWGQVRGIPGPQVRGTLRLRSGQVLGHPGTWRPNRKFFDSLRCDQEDSLWKVSLLPIRSDVNALPGCRSLSFPVWVRPCRRGAWRDGVCVSPWLLRRDPRA